jgi:hypothetical protein
MSRGVILLFIAGATPLRIIRINEFRGERTRQQVAHIHLPDDSVDANLTFHCDTTEETYYRFELVRILFFCG